MQSDNFKMLRKTTLEEMDSRFDIEYWQRQGSRAIFKAAHEMVIFAYRQKGWPLDERVRRDIVHIGTLEDQA